MAFHLTLFPLPLQALEIKEKERNAHMGMDPMAHARRPMAPEMMRQDPNALAALKKKAKRPSDVPEIPQKRQR